MRLSEVYQQKKTVLSFEIFPPKRDTTLKSIDETLEVLCGLKPDFISVTFGAGGSATNSLTVGLAKKIKKEYQNSLKQWVEQAKTSVKMHVLVHHGKKN